MTSQPAEEAKTSGKATWAEFFIRCKDPIVVVAAIAAVISAFYGGVVTCTVLFVDPKVETLREELTRAGAAANAKLEALRNDIRTGKESAESRTTALNDKIEDSSARIADNGERIAGMTATLAGTIGRVDRLHTQITKNTEAITELKVRGTPDVRPPE